MNRYHIVSAILFIAGISIILIFGNTKGGIFFIFPFIIGTGAGAAIGMLLIFLAFLFFTLGIFESFRKEPDETYTYDIHGERETVDTERFGERNVRGGGVVLIGPFPIVFGTDRDIAYTMLVIALILILVMILLYFSGILSQ